MNVCFETFGCRLNRAEALEEEASYLAAGHRVVATHSEADLIVVRGCSVTGSAQRECERLIAHLKHKYPRAVVRVCGCLERNKRAAELPPPKPKEEPIPMRTARAFLKVEDGCSNHCSFCIVPHFRGAPRSEDFGALIGKAERFLAAGYRELVVTGCNLSLYASGGKRLADLVVALAELEPHSRIRLGSLEPSAAVNELVEAMAEHPNICRYLHLSVQSGSDIVLKAMNRHYRVRELDELINRAQVLMPRVALGCDMIAGFPGETELDHLASQSFLARHRLSRVHAFPFSVRPGTAAELLSGRLPHAVRNQRQRELALIGERNRQEVAKSFLDTEIEVVGERHRHFEGWSGEYFRFSSIDAVAAHRRELVRCRVTKVEGDVLYGRPLLNGRRDA